MGLEARCAARFGKRESTGKVLLETNEVVFRGDFRVVIPLGAIQSATASGGDLILRYSGGTAILELGSAAPKWASKILHPKSLLDKLGIKPGMKVGALGLDEPDFLAQLRKVADLATEELVEPRDVIFFGVRNASDLSQLRTLERRIKPDGAIWIIRPKGSAAIHQLDVLQAGRDAGLVDVKVASFSATHTAEKFVIPLKRRRYKPARR